MAVTVGNLGEGAALEILAEMLKRTFDQIGAVRDVRMQEGCDPQQLLLAVVYFENAVTPSDAQRFHDVEMVRGSGRKMTVHIGVGLCSIENGNEGQISTTTSPTKEDPTAISQDSNRTLEKEEMRAR